VSEPVVRDVVAAFGALAMLAAALVAEHHGVVTPLAGTTVALALMVCGLFGSAPISRVVQTVGGVLVFTYFVLTSGPSWFGTCGLFVVAAALVFLVFADRALESVTCGIAGALVVNGWCLSGGLAGPEALALAFVGWVASFGAALTLTGRQDDAPPYRSAVVSTVLTTLAMVSVAFDRGGVTEGAIAASACVFGGALLFRRAEALGVGHLLLFAGAFFAIVGATAYYDDVDLAFALGTVTLGLAAAARIARAGQAWAPAVVSTAVLCLAFAVSSPRVGAHDGDYVQQWVALAALFVVLQATLRRLSPVMVRPWFEIAGVLMAVAAVSTVLTACGIAGWGLSVFWALLGVVLWFTERRALRIVAGVLAITVVLRLGADWADLGSTARVALLFSLGAGATLWAAWGPSFAGTKC
jgi:hypothetical protein